MLDSMVAHVRAMLELQAQGAVTFDYGNNLRGQVADRRGHAGGVRHSGLRARVHPAALLQGRGAVPLGGALRRSGRHRRDRSGGSGDVSSEGRRWPAGSSRPRSGCSSRDCPRGSAGSSTASGRRWGLRFNWLVRKGKVRAPIVIGRDHLDTGSVASPNRETEAMKDGSDAIADWPLLNALLNTACGASWVSLHHGGGVGIGYSIHAGMVAVADGTDIGRPPAGAGAHGRPRHRRDASRRRGLRYRDRDGAGAGCRSADDATRRTRGTGQSSSFSMRRPSQHRPARHLPGRGRPGRHPCDRRGRGGVGRRHDPLGRPAEDLPAEYRGAEEIDAGGASSSPDSWTVTPTSPLPAGAPMSSSSGISGRSYLEIAQAGGGIARTVALTREAERGRARSTRAAGFLREMLVARRHHRRMQERLRTRPGERAQAAPGVPLRWPKASRCDWSRPFSARTRFRRSSATTAMATSRLLIEDADSRGRSGGPRALLRRVRRGVRIQRGRGAADLCGREGGGARFPSCTRISSRRAEVRSSRRRSARPRPIISSSPPTPASRRWRERASWP